MTNYKLSILAVVFLAALPATTSAQPAENVDSIEAAIAILEPLAEQYPSLNVAVGVGDEIVWSQSWGMADIEAGDVATTESEYPLYSVAKPMTGVLAARLEEMGLFDPSLPIRTYAPDLPEHYSDITGLHLLGHSAGLRHYREDGVPYTDGDEWWDIAQTDCSTVSQALEFFVNDPLDFAPGQHQEYTTFGYIILSYVLERAGGVGYAALMQEHIFDPAGMRQTRLDRVETQTEQAVVRYAEISGEWRATDSFQNSCRFGGGGFEGTAEDLARFGLAYSNNTLTSDEAARIVETAIQSEDGGSFTGYAFAAGQSMVDGVEVRAVSHGGAAIGARSYLYALPSHDVSVAITGNLEGEHMYQQARAIGRLFAGLPE
jgi:serine beta-lactamase-like protein LACTB